MAQAKYKARPLSTEEGEALKLKLESSVNADGTVNEDAAIDNEQMIDLFQWLIDTEQIYDIGVEYALTALVMNQDGQLERFDPKRATEVTLNKLH